MHHRLCSLSACTYTHVYECIIHAIHCAAFIIMFGVTINYCAHTPLFELQVSDKEVQSDKEDIKATGGCQRRR